MVQACWHPTHADGDDGDDDACDACDAKHDDDISLGDAVS